MIEIILGSVAVAAGIAGVELLRRRRKAAPKLDSETTVHPTDTPRTTTPNGGGLRLPAGFAIDDVLLLGEEELWVAGATIIAEGPEAMSVLYCPAGGTTAQTNATTGEDAVLILRHETRRDGRSPPAAEGSRVVLATERALEAGDLVNTIARSAFISGASYEVTGRLAGPATHLGSRIYVEEGATTITLFAKPGLERFVIVEGPEEGQVRYYAGRERSATDFERLAGGAT